MLTTRWTEAGISVLEADPGPIRDGWLRLRVTGCGICGSDLHIYRGMQAGSVVPADFATPGHEIAGVIEGGPAGLEPDDAVYAIEPWVNCRECAMCVQGETPLCDDGLLLGISAGGGLAELVDVPQRLLHKVPDGVDPMLAPMAEPWAVAVRAVHRARLYSLDEKLLVLGGGNIGLLCGIAARDRVAGVGITCRYPHQAELARRFGLEPLGEDTVDDWSAEHRPGAVIETVGGSADTMMEAVRCVGKGGRVVVVGVFADPRLTDYREVVLKELELIGSFIYGTVGSGSEFGAAVSLMGSISEELAALQTHRFPLVDAPAAFAAADDKSSLAVKVTIGG